MMMMMVMVLLSDVQFQPAGSHDPAKHRVSSQSTGDPAALMHHAPSTIILFFFFVSA